MTKPKNPGSWEDEPPAPSDDCTSRRLVPEASMAARTLRVTAVRCSGLPFAPPTVMTTASAPETASAAVARATGFPSGRRGRLEP